MKRLLLIATLLVGCTPAPREGPPTIDLGKSECAHCGMIVSEERYAAGMAGAKVDDETKDLLFDDIGCMVKYTRAHGDVAKSARLYVHDADSKAWVEANAARFTRDPSTHTPMGSGIIGHDSTHADSSATTWSALLDENKH
ncbi:MAG: nitrous oxide reductase accessory protein NosL [Tepidisphaeraceae bacterium]